MVAAPKKQLEPIKHFKEQELNKSKGILDDHSIRKSVATREGTITKTPTADNDIANKKFVDDQNALYVPITGGTFTGKVFADAVPLGIDVLYSVEIGNHLTVGNNLIVDTNTLVVDSTNDRVGIGTIDPGEILDVVGNAEINGNIIVTGTVDGIDIATDVAANTTHRGLTNNPHTTEMIDDASPELGGEMDAGAHTIGFTQQTATGDGTTTINWQLGNKFYFTFGAQNDTFTFTAPSNPCNLILVLKQDGTGSRIPTFPGTVLWSGGSMPTFSTGANAVDIVALYYDGTNYFGVETLNFS